MLPSGCRLGSSTLIFGCAILVLAMIAPTRAKHCMVTLSDSEMASGIPKRAIYARSELKSLKLKRCAQADEKCLECLPVRDEMQAYISFCSSSVKLTDDRYRCRNSLLDPCPSESDDSKCRPTRLDEFKKSKATSCLFELKIHEQVSYNADTAEKKIYSEKVHCTGQCAVAVVYAENALRTKSGCSKYVSEWLKKFMEKHPTALSKLCEGGSDVKCALEFRFAPSWNGSLDTSKFSQDAKPNDVATIDVSTSSGSVGIEPVVAAPAKKTSRSTPKPEASGGGGAVDTSNGAERATTRASVGLLTALLALRLLRLA